MRPRKPSNNSSAPSRGDDNPAHWNFAPLPASRGCGVISAGGRKAHNSLAPIYGWFTEGFDTADLQEACAKRLL